MVWDEWEQLKGNADRGSATRTRLGRCPAGEGPGAAISGVTGGLKSTRRVWNRAGERVAGLREETGKALTRLQDAQRGTDIGAECVTAMAQKDVHDSWARYMKSLEGRCRRISTTFEQIGHDLLRTDDSVGSALDRLDGEYAETRTVGGRGTRR